MRDDLANILLPTHGEPIDPVAMARRDLRKAIPKRFYETAGVAFQDGAHAVLLDGRSAKTPARNALALPTAAAAEAVAAEWRAQTEEIDPGRMPLTRIVNSAIDGVARQSAETAAEIAKYASSDLVCYRAAEPAGLVAAQAAAWDPVLTFARETLGARFVCAEGIVFVAQPEHALRAVETAVASMSAGQGAEFKLAALHVMTTLTGSALLALALVHHALSAPEAWSAAHVDEDFQMRIWGYDVEALARRAQRWVQMQAAHELWQTVQ